MGPEIGEDNQKLPDTENFPSFYFVSRQKQPQGRKNVFKKIKAYFEAGIF